MVLRAHLALQAPAVQAALQVQMAVAEHQAPMEATGRVELLAPRGHQEKKVRREHPVHQALTGHPVQAVHQEQTVHRAQVAPRARAERTVQAELQGKREVAAVAESLERMVAREPLVHLELMDQVVLRVLTALMELLVHQVPLERMGLQVHQAPQEVMGLPELQELTERPVQAEKMEKMARAEPREPAGPLQIPVHLPLRRGPHYTQPPPEKVELPFTRRVRGSLEPPLMPLRVRAEHPPLRFIKTAIVSLSGMSFILLMTALMRKPTA